ncbi:caspase family protein [Coleofasciculus sp. FACHB-SPT36]|uniref:caspase family protein n=1 Tax=Cyanophyceae TaxID=3028117 RepID=UPI00168A7482|nr:caspase family protein [Coleofasciculus sp. FACHB-SPT36]MBD2539851.1 caspase family protein [Coleofasciculus sp. FACHB-SPT36]
MPYIKRRQFLQFAGSTLATLGLSQLEIMQQGDRFSRAIAQGTPRKLALLVGINAYPTAPLRGCVTDVELQQQLLIHRFGFNPKDILLLTDGQATRKGILNAFEEHLIKQAKAGDVVVFHFSGHGSQVTDPDCDFKDPTGKCLNSTFVPIDSALPTGFPNERGVVEDIMGHTLFLLMDALKTENVTAVLDSCHSGGGKRGNLVVRSRDGGSQLQPVPAEIEYQEQWLSRLNLSPAEFVRRRREGVAKGVVIASAKREQYAADAPFSDFYAGAFTYLMTQYLWQQTGSESFASALPNIGRNTTRMSSRQNPEFEAKPGSNNLKQPMYFIGQQTPPAEAVITKVEGNQAQLWLGGLNPQSLAAFEQDALLTVVDSQGREQGVVQLESRQGLIGRGKLLKTAKPGSLLQERTRGIPSDVTLKIGLDPSLGNDTAQAKQALQAIKRLEAVPLQQQEVQYIFGRMKSEGSLGLFSPAMEPIPDSFGTAGETVADAINRLQAKLKSLLAARIVKLTLNTNSSRLKVNASMNRAGQNEILASAFTVRGSDRSLGQKTSSNNSSGNLPSDARKLPIGTSVQFQITNNEPRDLYFSVLVIDPTGEISAIFPNQWTATDDVTQVKAGQTLQIPGTDDQFNLVTQEPKGVAEVLIVASSTPLRKALQALRNLAPRDTRGPVALSEPTQVVGDLLDDLAEGTRGTGNSPQGVSNVDTTQMAAMSITFEVI